MRNLKLPTKNAENFIKQILIPEIHFILVLIIWPDLLLEINSKEHFHQYFQWNYRRIEMTTELKIEIFECHDCNLH